ncbi:MAG TPA: protein DA1 [Mycobacteriales bacterium]|nr:protein DA1 [Mycobacteriales bacterium]
MNRAQVVLVPPSSIGPAGGSEALGLTRIVRANGVDAVRRIEIVSGLPQLLFERVLGHEIGHGFLAGCPDVPRTHAEVEGTCEMISSWWLHHRDNPFARQLLKSMRESPDPVYGGGYRLMRSAVDGQPVAEIVRRIRSGARIV